MEEGEKKDKVAQRKQIRLWKRIRGHQKRRKMTKDFFFFHVSISGVKFDMKKIDIM